MRVINKSSFDLTLCIYVDVHIIDKCDYVARMNKALLGAYK